ncbi:hypothetical protein [Achromobacter aloeverae]|uniref:Uncharacterized protein n=1 Tax=Achromobacter aloeverae TaxID=1750518 RepID=A0A4Q1HL14_9BURK|nr:hypothetical protein [Achromobacter aloeverae]RXN90305.1 hypothetical protein C7R54_12365 [Achromobacter aloeverae]
MSDLGLIIPKTNLFSNHKHGITAADDAQGSDSFQQQLSQALGVSALSQSTSGADSTSGTDASVATSTSTGRIGTLSAGAADASSLGDSSLAASTPEEALRQYTSSSLPQQMFYTMLSSMGITKEQFEAMTPQQQAQITQQLQERLKQAAAAGQLPGAAGLGQAAAATPVQASAASAQTGDALSALQALL